MSDVYWDIIVIGLFLMQFCWTMYLYHLSQTDRCKDVKKIWEYLEKTAR